MIRESCLKRGEKEKGKKTGEKERKVERVWLELVPASPRQLANCLDVSSTDHSASLSSLSDYYLHGLAGQALPP